MRFFNNMNLEVTHIKDLVIISPNVFGDERGYFFETYNKSKFSDLGIEIDFIQDNQSFSKKGTLRGLHYQPPPYAQTKLLRVLQGEIIDEAAV
jgi:dTDP-4-dehydrorhamnose 3,5-epimerase